MSADALDAAIAAMLDATDAYARARDVETMLEDARPLVKDAAIRALMDTRSLSATAAEKIVEADPTYAAHRLEQRQAAIATITARAQRIAAEVRVWAIVQPADAWWGGVTWARSS